MTCAAGRAACSACQGNTRPRVSWPAANACWQYIYTTVLAQQSHTRRRKADGQCRHHAHRRHTRPCAALSQAQRGGACLHGGCGTARCAHRLCARLCGTAARSRRNRPRRGDDGETLPARQTLPTPAKRHACATTMISRCKNNVFLLQPGCKMVCFASAMGAFRSRNNIFDVLQAHGLAFGAVPLDTCLPQHCSRQSGNLS